jgi:hypothetical protein
MPDSALPLFLSLILTLIFDCSPPSPLSSLSILLSIPGGCHDKADAEWIVNRRSLGGHNDLPFRRPALGRPIGRLVVGHPQGVFGVFSYYLLAMLFLNMICMTVTITSTLLSNYVMPHFLPNHRLSTHESYLFLLFSENATVRQTMLRHNITD